MVGKGSLIMILGFSLIFMVMGYFWGDLSSRSVDNHVSYYKNTIAHNIAVSGANIGLRHLLEDTNWVAGISDRPFENGLMNVSVSSIPMYRTITSVGTFMGATHTVIVKISRSSYAKYAWLIQSVSTGSKNNRPWVTGDIVYGGFHSNQFLLVDGEPIFVGKVSVESDVKSTEGSYPHYLGGFQTGVTVQPAEKVTFTMQQEAAKASQDANPTTAKCYFTKDDVWLTFYNDGYVGYRTATVNNHGGDPNKFTAEQKVLLTDMAPDGIIYVNANLYMSGTLRGEVTIVCEGASGFGGAGNVFFVDDLKYSVDPMIAQETDKIVTYQNGTKVPIKDYKVNPDRVDKLGILATNNMVIATSTVSGGYQKNVVDKDITLHGAFFSKSGGFHVDGLNNVPLNTIKMGNINLIGSMTAGKEEIVAVYEGNTLVAGYNRHVVLDEEFLIKPPLFFVYSTDFEILSWLE